MENESTLDLFVDSKLYRPLVHATSSTLLQHDLTNLTNWSADNLMELNKMKCKFMHMSRKRIPTHASYNINGLSLEQVSIIKDLGVQDQGK